MEIDELSEDQKMAAREAARETLIAAKAETLKAAPETYDELHTGSPQTPGYEADYGQTMKPAPQGYSDQEVLPAKEVAAVGTEFEDTLKEITGEVAAVHETQKEQSQAAPVESNAFDASLAEKLQESSQAPDQLHEPGGMEH